MFFFCFSRVKILFWSFEGTLHFKFKHTNLNVFINVAGYYCPEGSADKTPCPPGKFARNEGQATCDECTQGYYCPENTTEPIECPTGYICPASSSIGTAVPCGVGKFNNLTARYQSTDCVDCTPGYLLNLH